MQNGNEKATSDTRGALKARKGRIKRDFRASAPTSSI